VSDPHLQEVVMSALAAICRIDLARLGPDSTMEEIGFDSLGTVALIATLEATYDINLSPVAAERLLEARTLADLLDVTSALVQAQR
jgi:acyl carrier protein